MENEPISTSVRSPESPASPVETYRAESPDTAGGFWSVEVFRCDPEQSPLGHMVRYRVPRIEKMTILDALVHIQRHHDRSLAFRHACRLGICGTCTVMVNDVPRWACRTSIERLGKDTVRRRPCVICQSSGTYWWTTNHSLPSIAPHNLTLCRVKSAPKWRRPPQPRASVGPSIQTSNVLRVAPVTLPVRCSPMMRSTWGRRR